MRIVGAFLLAACVLTLTLMAGELRWPALMLPDWTYPLLQPLGRLLAGVWLWRVADETQPLR